MIDEIQELDDIDSLDDDDIDSLDDDDDIVDSIDDNDIQAIDDCDDIQGIDDCDDIESIDSSDDDIIESLDIQEIVDNPFVEAFKVADGFRRLQLGTEFAQKVESVYSLVKNKVTTAEQFVSNIREAVEKQ